MDYSGELSWEQLREIERLANEAVRADLPLRIWFPEEQELAALFYRSKLDLKENVRIVEIPGVDRCACCAPHVDRTGEVGLVKLLTAERHRGGVRVTAGLRHGRAGTGTRPAGERDPDLPGAQRQKGRGGPGGAAAAGEQQEQKARCDALSMALVARLAAAESKTAGNLVLFDSLLDEVAQRELVNLLMEKAGGWRRSSPGATGAAGAMSSAAGRWICERRAGPSTPPSAAGAAAGRR